MPKLDNMTILFFAWKATRKFGGNDGLFNSAGFSSVIRDALGLATLDGLIVKLILSGRDGIEQVGAAHWRLLEKWT